MIVQAGVMPRLNRRRTPLNMRHLAIAVPLAVAAVCILYLSRSSSQQWRSFQTAVRNRAAIELADDFHSGLNRWTGDKDWVRSWSYHQSGFVRTGKLLLWRDSIPMRDYRLEFTGEIEKKSLGWVFRAANLRNYYACRISISTPGPVPTASINRFAVIEGKKSAAVDLPLPLSIRNDTLYQVEVAVKGSSFVTSVNGQVVDSWSDDRLPTGGVGFFSENGEAAILRSVRISDRDDFVGRLCAYFAPKTADRKKEVKENSQ